MARRSRRSNPSGLPYLAVGLALGLAVAAGVYFSDLRSGAGLPASSDPSRARSSAPADEARPVSAGERSSERTGSPAASTERSAAAAPARPAEPRYDFYDELPRYEVVVPETGERPARAGAAEAPIEEPGRYVLQTGSFRSHADADRMQAGLALLGIESRIQKVVIDDQEYHRVRIGPIGDLDELNRIRSALRGAAIESLTMRVE